jgi:hypothetical protein
MSPGQAAAYAAKQRALLPVVEAFARGEKLQFRYSDQVPWTDAGFPSFTHGAECYRIKPSPRTFYGVVFPDGSALLDADEKKAVRECRGGVRVKMIEVL